MYLTNPLWGENISESENISEDEIVFYESVFDKQSNLYSVGLYNFHYQHSNLVQIHCKIEKT